MADGFGGDGGGGDRPRKTEGVGYGRPPKHSQFKKGQPSANPNGRPKKEKGDFAKMVKDTLSATVQVTENGKVIDMANREVVFKQLLRKAQSGDVSAAREVAKLARLYDVDPEKPFEESPEVVAKKKELAAKLVHLLNEEAARKKQTSESYKQRVARAQAEHAAREAKKAEDDDDGAAE